MALSCFRATYLFSVLLIGLLPAAQAARNAFNEKLKSLSLLGSHFGVVDIPATYDYVIVGGGTARVPLNVTILWSEH